jgi:hypothetical protein
VKYLGGAINEYLVVDGICGLGSASCILGRFEQAVEQIGLESHGGRFREQFWISFVLFAGSAVT